MYISFLKEKKISSFALGFLVLVFSLMEFYLVYSTVDFIRSIRFTNVFDGILSIVRFVVKFIFLDLFYKIKPIHVIAFIFLLIVVTFLVSILVTVILSGMSDFIKKEHNEIQKKNFAKVWGVIGAVTVMGIILAICLCVSTLPAFLVTSMYLKGSIELIYCIFFDIMTALTIISLLIYIRIPIWRILENIILNKKDRVSDIEFRKLVVNFIFFDVLYILTRIVSVVFFCSFDGTVIRTILFMIILLFSFAYEVIKTHNILNIFLEDTVKD